jgi:hypothetical protein
MTIWHILWSFGIFSPFWYIVPRKIRQPYVGNPTNEQSRYKWPPGLPTTSLSVRIGFIAVAAVRKKKPSYGAVDPILDPIGLFRPLKVIGGLDHHNR